MSHMETLQEMRADLEYSIKTLTAELQAAVRDADWEVAQDCLSKIIAHEAALTGLDIVEHGQTGFIHE